ncbi:tRNA-intron lyase [Candidatus Woesearchaeota archaeon]|nr:tRNA-intron lyase [Candidatus Woesearchaeota archaeon]
MERIKSWIEGKYVITENSAQAKELNKELGYGMILPDGRVQIALHEAAHLLEREKIIVLDRKDNKITEEKILGIAGKKEHKFNERYLVYKDLRTRGFIVQTALKFGADFRVYNKGKKPGQEHSKWIVYIAREGEKLTWREYSAKNRVAHSVKKKLLLAIIDDQGEVSYWESEWVRL